MIKTSHDNSKAIIYQATHVILHRRESKRVLWYSSDILVFFFSLSFCRVSHHHFNKLRRRVHFSDVAIKKERLLKNRTRSQMLISWKQRWEKLSNNTFDQKRLMERYRFRQQVAVVTHLLFFLTYWRFTKKKARKCWDRKYNQCQKKHVSRHPKRRSKPWFLHFK